MTPEAPESPHRHELADKHKKHRTLGLRNGNGEHKCGGYLVSYERLGFVIVASVGPYRAAGLTVGGANRRLSRKFHKHPEVRNRVYGRDNITEQNEEM